MAIGGLDVGTSGCKFVLYDYSGNTLYSAHREYSELGNAGRRELDPRIVLENVKEVLRDAALNSPAKIEGFAIASLGESTVAVSGSGEILYNSMATGDCRGIEESKRLERKFGAEEIIKTTGVTSSEMYSLPKWVWLNENTDAVKKAKYLFLYEDYITYMLTGERKVSYSSAARTMAFDIMKKQWSGELLNAAGLTTEMMSEPVMSGSIVGTVLPEAAEELGLPKDTLIVAGGHDQSCATIGGGVYSADTIEDGLGTCEVLSAIMPEVKMDGYMIKNDLMCIPYVLPDTFLSYLVLPTCGILMNWFRDICYREKYLEYKARGENIFNALDKMVSDEPTSLIVLPQFGSAGMPRINYDARGLFWGLTVHTTPIEMYRAVKEGISYHMFLAYETLAHCGIQANRIRLTGGGASPLTAQIRADIFNMQVDLLKNNESGTLGCAILTGAALGKFEGLKDGILNMVQIGRSFYPDQKRREQYMQMYEKYKKLYFLLTDFK